MATEEIQISELELADEVLADMVLPVDTATDTKAVTLKQLKAWLGSSLPTGFIIPAVGKIDDERFTLLDGKTLSRTGTYEAFCNKVVEQVQAGNWFACSEEEYNADVSTYGQCGRFVIANDYVRIPKITRFIGATITLSEIGKNYAESLPNITGDFMPHNDSSFCAFNSGSIETGVFKTNNYGTKGGNIQNTGGSYQQWILSFDASRSSSTYQDGAKVQPDHIKYPYYMVISTEGQTASVEIDINKVYEDLELKANSDLSNISSNIDYVVESYINGSEWYRVYKSGWVEQGGFISGSGTITLLKPFANAKYVIVSQATSRSSTSYGSDIATYSDAKTTTSVALRRSAGTGGIEWVAYGQGA